ncbi:ABC transporter permease [Colwellia sp. M166]|uniref:ABC transporter permease n=1 Tax=Colwellia sp. M166 TaxID=2583805 RepID=UPI00211DE44D|nr:ABC transporter permease [Colwellia sp. M166]UUO23242.1 ABC transporter permease [Colwellia sp. M166]|tara:strand:- start:11879 stop:13042 length:1164 start_codon:yes stop_codon:yes gene_type:complete
MMQLQALMVKEFKEAFRDRRALMVAMSMALLMPVMIMVMLKVAIKEAVDNPAVYVKYTGEQHAPKLIKALQDENILSFADVPEDEERNWNERNIALSIPDTFVADMAAGKPIELTLRADYNEKSLSSPIRRIKDIIREHSLTIGYKRLLVRGVDIKLLQPIKLLEQDTSLPSSNAVMISLILGVYLMMAAFMSGLPVAIDSSAGERERNVLEMLLCQPVSTLKIVLAKLSCASSIAIISIILMLVLTSVAMNFVDLTKIGATFSIDASTFAILLLLLVPICFLAASLQLLFAFQAKSFKEAQSTVTMLIMAPSFIPFALMMMDDKPAWVEWLPISGQSLLMEDVFKGLPIDWSALLFTSVATIVLTVALVLILAKRLTSEKVVMSLS